MSSDTSTGAQHNDSTENLFKFDEKFLITLTKDDSKSIEREAKLNCKILKIPSEFNIDEVFAALSALDPVEYPNLFIFIIEIENSNFLPENQENFQESKGRPLIIQLTSSTENSSKFYYQAENSTKIFDIDQHFPENLELFEEWENKLKFLLNGELGTIEREMLKKLSFIQDSSLILRFLRTLNLQEAFFGTLVLEIARSGTKNDLLAVLDAQFEGDGRILNIRAQNYIRYSFDGDESESESSDEMEESVAKNQSDELEKSNQPNEINEASLESNKKDSDLSVLLTSIKHLNKEVIDYLITYWSHLIQQLPLKHQIRISTAAFKTNQLDVLCDLLEIADFPFPQAFNTKSIKHPTLRKITDGRMKFKAAIKLENFKKIEEFIDQNLSVKFIYNPHNNNSALTEAIKLKKFGMFYYLKSLGFEGENCKDVLKKLSEVEKKEAVKQATEQRKQNIKNALKNVHKSVILLTAKSLIHNRRINKEQEEKFRENITKWFKDVHRIAPEMLDVAASCEHLKIIFDFESYFVENASLGGQNAAGVAYPTSKWIFIGAKFSDKTEEQKIKGVLAHELCHYVMKLVYENQEFPYHKDDKQIAAVFQEITKTINMWPETKSNVPDDECDGIISTVYRLYQSKDFEPELIVRVVNILAQYDDDENKSKNLQEKYKILFDFWQNHVISELRKYLQKNKEVVKLNGIFGLLSTFSRRKIEFKSPKNVSSLTDNKLTIITTNVPKLLLTNIHKHLHDTFGSLLDSQNLFLEPEKLENNQMWKDFKDICLRNSGLNIFVDCTKGVPDYLSNVLSSKDCNFVIIVSSESDCLMVEKLNAAKLEMNYSWNDLTTESQEKLLQAEINFQNNYDFSLMELLSNNSEEPGSSRSDQRQERRILTDFNEIIDDQLLNLLLEKQEIRINLKVESDSEESNFKLLYQEREFIEKRRGIKISQEELLTNIKNEHYVLLSDIAGTGKSWTVKNIANILCERNPTRWITYVDLKQFIEEFKEQKEKLEFSSFFVENILQLKNKFEGEIFKKLYKNGKVSIFFDGFDEIAPDCAEFVAKLAKLFEFNSGNQLWIATRDYFEVDLQKKLKIDAVFRLFQLTEEEGVDFIVASWVLKDSNKNKIISSSDFENILKSSPNLKEYHQKAEEIIQKIVMSQYRSVGLPQLFSMIAESFKESKNIALDLNRMKTYYQFAQKHYKRWSYEKGQLRKAANLESQSNNLNFWKFHQYCAVKSLFPEFLDLFFPDYDSNEWKEEEIIACGLMSKKGGKFYFLHETFREFFVADLIAKALKKSKINEKIFELFIAIMTIKKYEVIRMFLNDVIGESVLEKILPKVTNFITKFYGKETFSEFFTENLENLANLFIKSFKSAEYNDLRNILHASAKDVASKTEEQKMFLKFQEFMFESLKVDDLRQIIHEHRIFHKIIESRLEIEVFETFVMETLNRTDREFVRQELKLMDVNILRNLLETQNFSAHKVQRCFEIIQEFLTVTEVLELIEECDSKGRNILQICLREEKKGKFGILWMQIQNFYSSQQLSDKFKELVKHEDSNDCNLLHFAAECKDFDDFKTFWELLLKIFGNPNELKSLILKKNKLGNNFIHLLVINNQPKIIEFTFKSLKENFTESQYKEILSIRGRHKRNLLQFAACCVNQVDTFQMLWNEVKTSRKSNEEFLEILEEVDENGSNVFNLAACFTTGEIFEFMETELAKIASQDEIRKTLKNLNKWEQNLLQQAARQNENLELHEVLWKVIKKYFNSSEVLEFVKHLNAYGGNLIIDVIEENTKEIKDFSWKEVKEVLNNNNCGDKELKKIVERWDEIIKNAQQSVKLRDDVKEFLKLKWIEIENVDAYKLFGDSTQQFLEQKMIVKNLNDLMYCVADKSVENHQSLWDHLLTTCTTPEELKNLLTEKDENDNNFVHFLVIYNNADVIKFTFKKLKENLSEPQFQEILRSKGQFGRNLLQIAAANSEEVKTHQILWDIFQDSCKTNEEFLEILEEVDEEGNNVFNLAAIHTTEEIFKFMQAELAKIAFQEEIRKILKNLDKWKRNLLQTAAQQNKYLKLHEVLWKIIKKYFDSSEVLEFIKHLDIYGDNLLVDVTEKNTREITELTWKEVRKVLSSSNYKKEELNKNIGRVDDVIKNAQQSKRLKDDEREFLKLKWIKIENPKLFDDYAQQILEKKLFVKTVEDLMLFMADENVKNHQILWYHLLTTCTTSDELKNLLTEKEKDGDDFMHLLVIYNKADVIEFTFNKLKENLSEPQFKEILKSKGQFGRNLLQLAAVSKEFKTHQILWKHFYNSCKLRKDFLEILKEVDEEDNSVFHLGAYFTTGKIFEFMTSELRKLTSLKEIKTILSSLGLNNNNLLQSLVAGNKQLETNEMVWKIICKYFDAAEILEFINYSDKDGDNLLCNAVFWNTKEIIEFTWNQIKIFITSKDDQVEYLKKRGNDGKNLHQLSLDNRANDKEVTLWVQNVMQEYEITFSD